MERGINFFKGEERRGSNCNYGLCCVLKREGYRD